MEEGGEIVWHAVNEADGESAARNLHGRTWHVDGGAQGYDKSRYSLAHLVFNVWAKVTGIVAADEDVPKAVR